MSPSDGSTFTATQLYAGIAKLWCDESYDCQASYPGGAAAFQTDYASFGPTRTECPSKALAYYDPYTIEGEISKGRLLYDAAAAADCLASFSPITCQQFWDTGLAFAESCYHVFTGTVPDGGYCLIDECATSACDFVTHICGAPPPP